MLPFVIRAVACVIFTIITLAYTVHLYSEAGATGADVPGAFGSVFIFVGACVGAIWMRDHIILNDWLIWLAVAATVALGFFFAIFPSVVAGQGALSAFLGSLYLVFYYMFVLYTLWKEL